MYSVRSSVLPVRTHLLTVLRKYAARHKSNDFLPKIKQGGRFYYVRCYGTSVGAEPFLNGTSGSYVEEMYDSWKADPSSVHKVQEIMLQCLLYSLFIILRIPINK